MQQLNLDGNDNVKTKSEKRFWRRQFQKEATKSQIKFSKRNRRNESDSRSV